MHLYFLVVPSVALSPADLNDRDFAILDTSFHCFFANPLILGVFSNRKKVFFILAHFLISIVVSYYFTSSGQR